MVKLYLVYNTETKIATLFYVQLVVFQFTHMYAHGLICKNEIIHEIIYIPLKIY